MNQKTKKRFEAKINKNTLNGCWLWTAGKMGRGYGAFGIDGYTKSAHRVSYELYVGEISEGKHVLHNCDNRSCVNPNHLFIKTN